VLRRTWWRRRALIAAPAVALTVVSALAAAQSVEDIVAKNLAARGGAEKLRGVTSVRTTGRVKGTRGVATITMWTKRPNSMRREVVVDGGTSVTGFDGTTLWVINPLAGPGAREVTGPGANRAREEADDFDSVLLDYKDKGYTVDLVPSLEPGAQPRLRVTKKSGRMQLIYLDPATFLEQRITTELDQGGTKMLVETELTNYKPVDGMMVPFTIRQLVNGQVQAEVTYERVQFNLPLADDLFKMPKK
jgi:outer membrane lipoprotein-sorting protein